MRSLDATSPRMPSASCYELFGSRMCRGPSDQKLRVHPGTTTRQAARERVFNVGDKVLATRNAEYEEALEKFESVLRTKSEPDEAAVASYNVACCYSKLHKIQAALFTLKEAINSGFEDFKRILTDPDLANARASPEFKTFDESFINENAIKSIFGIFNKE
ncbi:protein MET1, chloroplastic-like [Vicia villosa]|uniref:protein MET1, chloroplastic-like n=1 Tax=Vicia villosa TaxID=3911 RepID=UPI00273B9CC7|nr:protein MET1, chloroplastic-like [Vicia villosa]